MTKTTTIIRIPQDGDYRIIRINRGFFCGSFTIKRQLNNNTIIKEVTNNRIVYILQRYIWFNQNSQAEILKKRELMNYDSPRYPSIYDVTKYDQEWHNKFICENIDKHKMETLNIQLSSTNVSDILLALGILKYDHTKDIDYPYYKE